MPLEKTNEMAFSAYQDVIRVARPGIEVLIGLVPSAPGKHLHDTSSSTELAL